MSQLETQLVQDGHSGEHIKQLNVRTLQPDAVLFQISPNIDQALRALAERFLPFGTQTLLIQTYIEVYSNVKAGLVHHALAETLAELLNDYFLFVAQLEQKMAQEQRFGLANLWTWVQNTAVRLEAMATLVHELMSKDTQQNYASRGGQVLSILHDRYIKSTGIIAVKQLMNHLLNRASRPYFSMIMEWVEHGNLYDPHDEFFIVMRSKKPKSEGLVEWWWLNGLVIRGFERAASVEDLMQQKHLDVESNQSIPSFLKHVAKDILQCGKCWHVLSACGKMDNVQRLCGVYSDGTELTFDKLPLLETKLKGAFKEANTKVIRALFDDFNLIRSLQIMKHYFFMSTSDFITQLLDTSLETLRLPSSDISLDKLQSLLDLALKASACDLLRDDELIKVSLSKYAFVDMLMRIIAVSSSNQDPSLALTELELNDGQNDEMDKPLTGLQTFTLDVNVPFPVSLILSKKTVTKYQLIFRQLFTLKSVEYLLNQTWIEHQAGYKKINDSKTLSKEQHQHLETSMRAAWLLRCRMTAVLQGLHAFIADRLEIRWEQLYKVLLELKQNPENLDDLMERHDQFLDTCLRECLVTNKKLIGVQHHLFRACSSYSFQTERFMKTLIMDPSVVFIASGKGSYARSPLEMYKQVVDKTSKHLKECLDTFGTCLDVLASVEGDTWVADVSYRMGLVS